MSRVDGHLRVLVDLDIHTFCFAVRSHNNAALAILKQPTWIDRSSMKASHERTLCDAKLTRKQSISFYNSRHWGRVSQAAISRWQCFLLHRLNHRVPTSQRVDYRTLV